MRKLLMLVALLSFLLVIQSVSSGGESSRVRLDIKEHILKNGMKVIIMERHTSPTVAVNIVFKVGSVNERPGITGLSHIVEHMLSKGTKRIGTRNYQMEKPLLDEIDKIYARLNLLVKERARLPLDKPAPQDDEIKGLEKRLVELKEKAQAYRIPDEISMLYKRHGAQGLNASTSNEITWYYCELPSNKLELWAWLESDRFSNPVWRDFEEEKSVILEERRWRNESNPGGTLYENFNALCYQAHPLNWPVIGWRSDIEAVTKEELNEYFHQYYAPNNAAAIIVGDVDEKQVMELMRKYFDPIPPSPKPVPEVVTREPEQLGERRVILELDAEPMLDIGYHTTTLGTLDDYALDIVSMLLFGGRTSRMYKKLVLEKKLCTSVGGYNDAGKYPGRFIIYAQPRYPHTPQEVEQAIYEELEKFKNEKIADEEMTLMKKRMEVGFLMGLDSNLDMAETLGHYEGLASWRYILDVNVQRDKVTQQDIKNVMEKYFIPKNRNVAILMSKQTGDKPAEKENE
ncbi:MAG: insulinase family protein [Planctomycetes bacterium]|nr:insulinase family protein [Planctomycetota bacterium]